MTETTDTIVLQITGDGQGAQMVIQDLLGALKDLGKAIDSLKKGSAPVTKATSQATDGLKGLGTEAKKTQAQSFSLKGAFQGLGSMIMSLNPASLAAMVGLGWLFNMLAKLGRQIMSVVDQAQTLQINLESLAARELVKAKEFENIDAAMGKATLAAAGLLRVLEEIGLESPYANEQVVQTFRSAMAYGWASNQAMMLTRAMLDMAAAMGKSGWEMMRISINLGQIRSKGRIAGQELRDLAGLGINLADILQDRLGVSVEQFNAGLNTGKFTMDDFAKAISEYVDTNFAGAAQRLSRTIQGIKASLQDLSQIGMRKLFKPAADVITAALADRLESAIAWVKDSGALEKAGAILERIAKGLVAVGDFVRTALNGLKASVKSFDLFQGMKSHLDEILWLLNDVGRRIYELLGPALSWLGGLFRSFPWHVMAENLRDTINSILRFIKWMLMGIRSLLRGDAQGAVDPFREAFVTLLTMIAVTMDRFVGDMLVWGWNLVVQLATGIVNAAKTVLKAAMNFLGQIIGLFLKPGSPPKEGPLSHIVEWGRGLINTFAKSFKLVDFGVLREALGPIQQAFQDAFAAGNLTEPEYLEQFRTVRTQVAGLIADFRQTGEINTGMLDAISQSLGEGGRELVKYLELQLRRQQALKRLADVQAEVAEAEKAGFISEELRQKVAAAEAEAAAAEEQVNWQKELIALQRESVDIQLRLIKALEALAQKGGVEPKAGGADAPVPTQPEFASGLGEFIGLEQMDFSAFDDLSGTLDGLSEKWHEWHDRISAFLDMPLADKIGLIAQKITDITGIDFAGWWDKISVKLTDLFGPALEEVQLGLERVRLGFQIVKDFIADEVQPRWEAFTRFLRDVWWPLLRALGIFLQSVFGAAIRIVTWLLEGAWILIKTKLTPSLETLWGVFRNTGTYLSEVFTKAIDGVIKVWTDFKDLIDGPVGRAFDWFTWHVLIPMADWIGGISQALKDVTQWFLEWADKINSFVPPAWAVGHSPPPMAKWFGYIADATARANDEFGVMSRLFGSGFAHRGLAGAGASAFRSGMVVLDGDMVFPNVRDGRDAWSLRGELRRITEEGKVAGKIRGVVGR